MKRTYRTSGIAALALAAAATAALAEPLPIPSSDYSTKGTMAGGMTVAYRHSNGKMRMEMKSPDMPQPMVGYFDMKTRKGIMVMSMPGMPPVAMETGLENEGGAGVAGGNGQRVGSDRVAGEACDLWRFDATTAEAKAMDGVACITHDGIVLRMVGTLQGKRQTIFEVTELSRTPQDMKQLTPPANLKPMQIPKGMTPPRK